MGLISFAKHAGKRLLGRDDSDENRAEPAPPEPSPPEPAATPAAQESPPAATTTSAPAGADASASAAEGTVTGAGGDRTYTTRAGDTLAGIAAYFYGDAVHQQRLLDENPGLAAAGDPLAAGLRLRVPEDASLEAGVPLGGSADAQAAAGDRLVALVAELGIPVENLSIQVRGDLATVTGTAPTQADREKAVLVVGNTSGIAQVDDQLQVQEPAAEAFFYTVQEGDTLWGIAAAQYGDGAKYQAIFEANQPMLDDPDRIYPGQVLRIPPQ